MKIDLPIKIHNKFLIEVRDIASGEIVQEGYAENIVLNNFFTTSYVFGLTYVGETIIYGDGIGTLDPARTALFNVLGNKESELVEVVANHAPTPSYGTKKITILPTEHIGKSITEVGLGYSTGNNTIFTHALIKDSEGNLLTLGPKTGTQEITIYATVYFQPNFEPGITLYGNNLADNGLIRTFTCTGNSFLRHAGSGNNSNYMLINNVEVATGVSGYIRLSQNGAGKVSFRRHNASSAPVRYEASQLNGTKIKTVGFVGDDFSPNKCQTVLINLPTLAQNNSTIWGGWEFDKTLIGTGDGIKTVFTLPWNEARLDKAKTVYVNGVAESGVTWSEGSITFNTAPADQSVITADYWVDYIPKDSDHVLDLDISINYGEGTPT